MRCVTPGGYSGHYKGIEEGAAYCHTRSTTCREQDEEEGQRRAQNIGKMQKKMKTNQGAVGGAVFMRCIALSYICIWSLDRVALAPLLQCSMHSVRHLLFGFVFGYCSVLFAALQFQNFPPTVHRALARGSLALHLAADVSVIWMMKLK